MLIAYQHDYDEQGRLTNIKIVRYPMIHSNNDAAKSAGIQPGSKWVSPGSAGVIFTVSQVIGGGKEYSKRVVIYCGDSYRATTVWRDYDDFLASFTPYVRKPKVGEYWKSDGIASPTYLIYAVADDWVIYYCEDNVGDYPHPARPMADFLVVFKPA